ncbi:hypothetical protein [Halostreptopolyspora alba]|uniref:Uncharacterized protein n=1 Tax=Halostreptopolyspora alba TaxID=2487137 RepID=A0A3N0E8P6_9ACTN|nr:hypothetical protein EFW17_13420 [Nocardiopsaceae bacterium YIM 96095]
MTAYLVATRHGLVELSKNRLAAVILLCLIPVVITLAYVVVTDEALVFRHRTMDVQITAWGNETSTISVAVNLVSQLVGFAMFAAAHRAGEFDRRLVGAGYPRLALIAAKLTTLALTAAVVSGYATVWVGWYWQVQQPPLLWLGLFLSGVVYGSMGLFLALFLPGELEGLFVIILATVIDMVLQNPIINPTADSGTIALLPGYGGTQLGLAAGFTDSMPTSAIAVSALWAAVLSAIAFGAFCLRTRNRLSTARHNRLLATAPGDATVGDRGDSAG